MSKIDLKQRRMFLQGLGTYLAIPFLPSLLTKAQAAAVSAPPVRFVAMFSKNGVHRNAWVPNVLPSQEVRPGVYAMPLTNISGPISPSLGPAFDSLRDKLTFITGLDILNIGGLDGPTGHNQAAPLSSGNGKGHTHGSIVGYTIDEIMARSKNVYPSAVKTPAIRLSPYFQVNPSWSFWAGENVPYQTSVKSVFDSVFGGIGNQTSGQFEADKKRQLLAIDKVLPEFNRIRQGSAISSEDKQKIENFADHLQDLQKSIGVIQQVVGCTAPNLNFNNSGLSNKATAEAIFTSISNLMVAAMACNLTRIGVVNIGYDLPPAGTVTGENPHDNSHNLKPPKRELDNAYYRSWTLNRVAEMMNKMNAITESNGKTLLDNSIVFYGNEFASGAIHEFYNMPVVIGGSAGGKIRTGNYISYETRPFVYVVGKNGTLENAKIRRHPMGRPYNDLMMDFMRCMGVTAPEWEMGKPGAGFGEYSNASHVLVSGHYDKYLVGNRSNKSLPYFLMSS